VEVGSEFYHNSVTKGKNEYQKLSVYPHRYLVSGITGLGLIANELKNTSRSILVPDYCCSSMIRPFMEQGLEVSFYDAFNLNHVEIADDVDAVLAIDYFGFISKDTLAFSQKCKEQGKLLVVDATQTAFSYAKTYELADYIIVSYRKWFDSLCAVVYNKNGFTVPESTTEYSVYLDAWRQAAILKEKYIKFSEGEKQNFLDLYALANKLLHNEYEGFKTRDSEIEIMLTADSASLRATRRANAQLLMDEVKALSETYDIQLLYHDIEEEDCPLFVPIIVNENKRHFIHLELVKSNVYCPCHWPVNRNYLNRETRYSRSEISLVCDQRYGTDEMRMQISALSRALELSTRVEM